MTDVMLTTTLIDSYKRQLTMYTELGALVQKTLSQIVLTRGDVSGIMLNFVRKQVLLDGIIKERNQTEQSVQLWQERKYLMEQNEHTAELDSVLMRIQSAIQEFMVGEEQLKKYLEHVVQKGSVA